MIQKTKRYVAGDGPTEIRILRLPLLGLLLGLLLVPQPVLLSAQHAVERKAFHEYARERLDGLARLHDEVELLITERHPERLGAEADADEADAARLRELGRQRARLAAKLDDLETRSGYSWKKERQRMMELLAVLQTHYTSLKEKLSAPRNRGDPDIPVRPEEPDLRPDWRTDRII